MKSKRILLNAASSLLSYGLLLVFSILSSRFILVDYGSETNGLLSSVNQLFTYLALLEAGIGTSTLSALYKPVSHRDSDGVSRVLAASQDYYRRSAKWYLLCVTILSFLWPLVLNTTIPYGAIFGVIFFHGLSSVITYWYTSTIINYLQASGQHYVNNAIHFVTTLMTYLSKIVIASSRLSIVLISVAMVAINLLRCLLYRLYVRKKCPEFRILHRPDRSLLKQRSSFLMHEISGVIFSSTDMITLSVFCSLSAASVYNVYALVLGALRTLIGQVFASTNFMLGNSYAGDRQRYVRLHDRYNTVYITGVFAVFTVAYWLVLPFIRLYTAGVTDANYLDPGLPLLFVLIELLSACRIVDNQLIKIALHAKQTLSRSFTESVINLVVSLAAVQFIGIYGVLLGTIAALLYRTNDIILYTNRRILERSALSEYVLYVLNFCCFAFLVWLAGQIPIAAESYLDLLLTAIPTGAGILLCYALVNLAAHPLIRRIR